MASNSADRPIIVIRKKKKGGHGHHGGAWKVAYADFVTAMMAFFLLMWLLASVEAGDRAAIASYFKRPLSDVFTNGGRPGGDRLIAQSMGTSANGGALAPGTENTRFDIAEIEEQRLEALQEEFESMEQTSPLFQEFADQLRVELTEEGLSVQLLDEERRPMFATGSAGLQPYARELLTAIAETLHGMPNRIALTGHTDATPYAGGEGGYSNWELSADRANAARRALVAAGVDEGMIARVQGLASSSLLEPDAPYDPANRRISILILRQAPGTPGAEPVINAPDQLPAEIQAQIDAANRAASDARGE